MVAEHLLSLRGTSGMRPGEGAALINSLVSGILPAVMLRVKQSTYVHRKMWQS